MSKDDVEKAIREAASEPTEISADDLEPPVCTWCGDEIGPETDVTVWDIPEQGNKSVVWRYRYCSDGCRDSDENAAVTGETMHPHGEPERIDTDEHDVAVDGRER